MTLVLPDAGQSCLIHGACEEAHAALLVAFTAQHNGTSIALIANPRRAEELAAECESHTTWLCEDRPIEILYFPEEPPPDIDANRRADRICERLMVLSKLLAPEPTGRLLIATPEALFGTCPDRAQFEARQIKLSVGNVAPFGKLINRLTNELDYDAEAICESPGQLAVRGGLLDIYPYDANEPYRLDFFGDEIESIRSFDPTSQRTIKQVNTITIATADNGEAKNNHGNLSSFLSDESITWLLEDPAKLVREHPFRFDESKAPSGPPRTLLQLLSQQSRASDRRIGISELDTEPKIFAGAERIELSTEPTGNYRLHPDAVQVGYDRFESEQSARSRFESQLADWSEQDKLAIHFITQGLAEAERIRALLAENPRTAKLEPIFHCGDINGGFIYRSSSTTPSLLLPKAAYGFILVTDHEYFGHRRRKLHSRKLRARTALSQVCLFYTSDAADE